MNTLCPICGQQNDITGHTCWVQTIAPTAWNNHHEIRSDNTAVIIALEKRVEELEFQEALSRMQFADIEEDCRELREENQRLHGILEKLHTHCCVIGSSNGIEKVVVAQGIAGGMKIILAGSVKRNGPTITTVQEDKP